MSTDTRIDWTLVVNYDNYGSVWGVDGVEDTDSMIERARANGQTISEWHMRDRDGLRHRVVRIADPDFLDTICVFPDECDDCGWPVTTLAWVSDEHHPKCPHRDPHF
jgi:hypothetical protein